ncbi:DUF4376 domain-containing protein [Pseudomonas gingeri]|uniref:DUF4376 domain-containing protein n=1 Tax=Pseudomonas gingeri TaxID=117681 RepID=UPI0015B9B03F|nr:hypothetical protein [Pseudomonas gingeri]NWD47839.1 hypothetical protein [Pseudomonas gingeri]
MFATWIEADQRWAFGVDGLGSIQIATATFRGLLEAQSSGASIGRDSDGLPVAIRAHNEGDSQTLEARYAAKIEEIDAACVNAITGGFQSSALGKRFEYSSQFDDQLNLTGAILRGVDMPYACRDELGAKDFRLHTAEQLKQVGDDLTVFKLQLLQYANDLKQQVDRALAAGDIDALKSVTWESAQP